MMPRAQYCNQTLTKQDGFYFNDWMLIDRFPFIFLFLLFLFFFVFMKIYFFGAGESVIPLSIRSLYIDG